MCLYRIFALMVRYLLEVPRDFFRIFDLTFYPTMDIILWGFMSLWVQTNSVEASRVGPLMLISLVFWMLVENANREIAFNLTEELYAKNLVNILVTPLQLREWIAAVVSLAVLRSTFVFILCSCIVWVLRDINVFVFGPLFFVLYGLLLMSGIALGLAITALLIRWGRRISTFIWSIPYLILSFSAVFYPIDLLPSWAQYIGKAMPISHSFYLLRNFVATGTIAWTSVYVGLALNVTYLMLSSMLFLWMFNRSRNSGLAQIEYY